VIWSRRSPGFRSTAIRLYRSSATSAGSSSRYLLHRFKLASRFTVVCRRSNTPTSTPAGASSVSNLWCQEATPSQAEPGQAKPSPCSQDQSLKRCCSTCFFHSPDPGFVKGLRGSARLSARTPAVALPPSPSALSALPACVAICARAA